MTSATLHAQEREHARQLQRSLDGAAPIACFANDWRGDPTSKHHIMRLLAEHVDVLWVEASGMRRPRLLSAMDLRRALARLRRSAAGPSRDADAGRLQVLSPLTLPLPGNGAATRLNGRLYRRSLGRALDRQGATRPPLLWVYNPIVAPHLDGIPHSGLVYHCVDRWWAFSEYDERLMRRYHATLCRRADVVFASAAALLDDCREHTDRAYLMPHGVEWAHFARAAVEDLPCPAELADVRGPVLGFFGLIHEWVDLEVVRALALAFPQATLALIGKVQVDVGRLRDLPNVRLLGQKPYHELPAYAARFDVGLIPFAINELTTAVNPIKLREYLSAGLPVAATALPEIEALPPSPVLRTARDAAGFVSAVAELLPLAADRELRRATARSMAAESWVGRCAEMVRLVRHHLPS